jgi:hydroxypyruvate isomerase
MPKFSAHLGYLFADRPVEQRFEAARRSGFRAVEHPAPYRLAAPTVATQLRAHDLSFVQLAAVGEAPGGEKGLAGLPGREAEFRVALDRALDYAAAIGCRMVHAMSGVVPADVDPETAWMTYIENLRYAARAASAADIQILIEPISEQTVPNFLMCHPELALKALADASDPNIAILYDVYHSVVCDCDPVEFLKAHAGTVGHVHIADSPGRHEPGTGSIPFAEIFSLLDENGYAGHVGCEYIPAGVTEAGLGWLGSANPHDGAASS